MSAVQANYARYPSMAAAEARLASFSGRLRTFLDCDGQWESDRQGHVVWFEGDFVAIGEPIASFEPGSDLSIAFARRAPFRDFDSGHGWRLSAVPYFERGSGRFLGYRGQASRGTPAREIRDLFGTGASADAFANMAHEARTPLSAIMGFAQMIEAETLGEAGADYRERAGAIVRSATRLLDAVDDLASAAQLEQGRYPVVQGATDITALIAQLVKRYAPLAARRAVRLSSSTPPSLRHAALDERVLGRALDRIASTLLAVAADETLALAAQDIGSNIEIVISRPFALAGLSADALLDPANPVLEPGAVAPVLGLGFGIRLAAGLIEASGGAFAIESECIRIIIPGIAKSDRTP